MAAILDCDEGVEREKKAEDILKSGGRAKALADLAKIVADAFDCKITVTKPSKKIRTPGAFAARLCLSHYRRNFVHYDLVTYPVQYGSGVGEANSVDVFRVSPEDATGLMNESDGDRRKLAGTALMSFGAFLDEGWRKNDMLWGRLDGAERLITALLPDDKTDKDLRNSLIKEAHMSILHEVLKTGDLETICQLVGSTLAGRAPSSDGESKLQAFVRAELKTLDLTEPLRSALQGCLDTPEKIWAYYKKDYEVNREIKAEAALQLISRATNVTGKMLQGLSEDYRYKTGSRVAAWISRLGLVFWNLVAVAVPDTLRNLFFRHALGLLYLFDFALIFGGILFNAPVKALGWEMLGFTIVLHLVTATLGDYMSGKRIGLWIARIAIAVGLIGLIICGALYLSERWLTLTPAGEARLAAIVAGTLLIAVATGEIFRSRRGKTGKIDKKKERSAIK